MKIAVASVDGVSISRHFGRSRCFIVFEIHDDRLGEPTIRPNIYTAHAKGECDGAHHQHAHSEPHDHVELVAGLRDCAAVLCYGMGWRAAEELEKHGITPFAIDGEVTPMEAVHLYLAGNLKPAAGFCRCHT